VDAPYGFKHALDLDLFALDRLDHLCRTAPEGKLKVQLGDEGRERPAGTGPVYTELLAPLADDVAARRLHVHLHDVAEWAPAPYGEAYAGILAEHGGDEADRHAVTTVLRVFTPDVPVALHADGEIAIDVGAGGRNVWHFYDRDVLSEEEHEALHRGGQFLRWRDADGPVFDLAPGDGCVVPSRWPHWLEHPGPDPAVSFDIGYWTAAAIRERKAYDVNFMLRKMKLTPSRPGRHPGRDTVKRRAFDVLSRATGKGAEYRGI
jgi:hypothetical protein